MVTRSQQSAIRASQRQRSFAQRRISAAVSRGLPPRSRLFQRQIQKEERVVAEDKKQVNNIINDINAGRISNLSQIPQRYRSLIGVTQGEINKIQDYFKAKKEADLWEQAFRLADRIFDGKIPALVLAFHKNPYIKQAYKLHVQDMRSYQERRKIIENIRAGKFTDIKIMDGRIMDTSTGRSITPTQVSNKQFLSLMRRDLLPGEKLLFNPRTYNITGIQSRLLKQTFAYTKQSLDNYARRVGNLPNIKRMAAEAAAIKQSIKTTPVSKVLEISERASPLRGLINFSPKEISKLQNKVLKDISSEGRKSIINGLVGVVGLIANPSRIKDVPSGLKARGQELILLSKTDKPKFIGAIMGEIVLGAIFTAGGKAVHSTAKAGLRGAVKVKVPSFTGNMILEGSQAGFKGISKVVKKSSTKTPLRTTFPVKLKVKVSNVKVTNFVRTTLAKKGINFNKMPQAAQRLLVDKVKLSLKQNPRAFLPKARQIALNRITRATQTANIAQLNRLNKLFSKTGKLSVSDGSFLRKLIKGSKIDNALRAKIRAKLDIKFRNQPRKFIPKASEIALERLDKAKAPKGIRIKFTNEFKSQIRSKIQSQKTMPRRFDLFQKQVISDARNIALKKFPKRLQKGLKIELTRSLKSQIKAQIQKQIKAIRKFDLIKKQTLSDARNIALKKFPKKVQRGLRVKFETAFKSQIQKQIQRQKTLPTRFDLIRKQAVSNAAKIAAKKFPKKAPRGFKIKLTREAKAKLRFEKSRVRRFDLKKFPGKSQPKIKLSSTQRLSLRRLKTGNIEKIKAKIRLAQRQSNKIRQRIMKQRNLKRFRPSEIKISKIKDTGNLKGMRNVGRQQQQLMMKPELVRPQQLKSIKVSGKLTPTQKLALNRFNKIKSGQRVGLQNIESLKAKIRLAEGQARKLKGKIKVKGRTPPPIQIQLQKLALRKVLLTKQVFVETAKVSSLGAEALVLVKFASAQKQSQLFKVVPALKLLPRQAQDISTAQKYSPAQLSSFFITPVQVQAVKQAVKLKIPQVLKSKLKKVLNILSEIKKGARRLSKPLTGYNVFGKVRGKFIKLNQRPLIRTDALDRMSSAIDGTTARTGKIKPVGKVSIVGRLRRGEKGSFAKAKKKFRQVRIKRGKRKRLINTFIEKKGKPLIDTRGEKSGLSLSRFKKKLRLKRKSVKRITKKRKKK